MVAATPLPSALGFSTTACGPASEASLLAACPPRVPPNDGSTVARSGWHASAMIEAPAMTRRESGRLLIAVASIGEPSGAGAAASYSHVVRGGSGVLHPCL